MNDCVPGSKSDCKTELEGLVKFRKKARRKERCVRER